MPIKQAARKALRQSLKNEAHNLTLKRRYKEQTKLFRMQVSLQEFDKAGETYKTLTQALDKAAKEHVIHKNKASRLKSRLAISLNVAKSKPKVAEQKKAKKPRAKKAAKKAAK